MSRKSTSETTNLITISFAIITITVIIFDFMKRFREEKKEQFKEKQEQIQLLVNTLQNIENKYHKSFIDWYKKNNKDTN